MMRSQTPIDVRRVGPDRRKLHDLCMVGGKVTHRIGGASITGEREGLAATAAEVELPTRTAGARLLHPCGAAEGIESRGVGPDVGERMFAYVPELQARERLRGMTGQHFPRRRHVERASAPAADARLWKAGVVVRDDGVDDDAADVTRAQLLHRGRGPLDLLASGH